MFLLGLCAWLLTVGPCRNLREYFNDEQANEVQEEAEAQIKKAA